MSVDRRYAMTRLGKGDYLLPSNDGRLLYRIRRQDEPESGDPKSRILSVWAVWRWLGAMESGNYANVEDENEWELIASWFDSRQRAIEWALK